MEVLKGLDLSFVERSLTATVSYLKKKSLLEVSY